MCCANEQYSEREIVFNPKSSTGLILAAMFTLSLSGCGGGSANEPTTPNSTPTVNQSAEAGGTSPAVVASTSGSRGIGKTLTSGSESGGDSSSNDAEQSESSGPETCSSGGGRGADVCGAGDTDGEQ